MCIYKNYHVNILIKFKNCNKLSLNYIRHDNLNSTKYKIIRPFINKIKIVGSH